MRFAASAYQVLAVFAALAGCDASPHGAPNADLTSDELKANFSGKSVRYEPRRTYDAGVVEDFHMDGTWTGRRFILCSHAISWALVH